MSEKECSNCGRPAVVMIVIGVTSVGDSGWFEKYVEPEGQADAVYLCSEQCAPQMLPVTSIECGLMIPIEVGKLKRSEPDPEFTREMAKLANMNAAKKRMATIARNKASKKKAMKPDKRKA